MHAKKFWTRVVVEKYIVLDSVEDWIRKNNKVHLGGSVIWKVVVKNFNVIEDSLSWNIINGRKLRVGEDSWVGCNKHHRLS